MINTDSLKMYAHDFGIELDHVQLENFSQYADLLLEWNQKINLTAITVPEDVIIKHFLDSITLLPLIKIQNAALIDVGTGAGFPGVPLKIVRPDLKLTMLESLKKRTEFLKLLSRELNQDNVCIHGRAEELSRKEGYREVFDYAVARAVASLNTLCEFCLPFVRQGGYFIASKGPQIETEIDDAKGAISELGGRIEDKIHLILPNGNARSIIVISKISQTPSKYPRKFVKISKTPLM